MTKPAKIFLFIGSGLAGLLVFVAVLLFFADAKSYKPRFEASASEALGMEVKVNGRLGLSFFPGLLVTLKDMRIRGLETDIVSAKEVRIEVELIPLFNKEIRINKITLKQSTITIERDSNGRFNFEQPETAGGTVPSLNLTNISLSGGTLLYVDKQSGEELKAKECDLNVHHLQLSGGDRSVFLKNLSLTAELACEEAMTKDFAAADVKFSLAGGDGIFDFKPVLMRVYGGQGSGSIRADLSDVVPLYHVNYSLSQFHLKEFFNTLPPDKAVEGMMDFFVDVTMRGKTRRGMRETIAGKISLRGKDLTLNGSDLDQEFARFESSQNFNLVDVGAVFFAGPLGLIVTKGYTFASLLQGSGGSSKIRTIVSDWKIERGMAQAQDVAMATKENRIALKGGLDFINKRFHDVTVALIDAQGCAKVHQKIRGTFEKPEVETPNIFKSLTGPFFNFLKKGRDLLPGGECEVFYSGSVAPPK